MSPIKLKFNEEKCWLTFVWLNEVTVDKENSTMKGLTVSQNEKAVNFFEGQVNRFEKLLTEKQKCSYLNDSNKKSFSQCIVLIVMSSVLGSFIVEASDSKT